MDGPVVQRWRVGCALASLLLGSACTDASTSPATGTSATTDVQAKPMTAVQPALDIAITDLDVGQPVGGYLATAINDAGWVAGASIGRERTNTTATSVMRAMTINHHRRLPGPGSDLIRDNHIPASSPTHGKMTGPGHDQATPCIPARMILQAA